MPQRSEFERQVDMLCLIPADQFDNFVASMLRPAFEQIFAEKGWSASTVDRALELYVPAVRARHAQIGPAGRA